MGDGSAERHGLIICTNSYSVQDLGRLMNVLMIRYGLECRLLRQLLKRQNNKIEYMIYIRQGSIDLPLLYKIQSFFGGIGSITVNGQTASFRVSKVDDIINVIIPHFNQYPLQSAKLIDFQL